MGRRIWIDVPGELVEEIEALAAARCMSRTEFLEAALRDQVEAERLGEVLEFSNSLSGGSAEGFERARRGRDAG